MKPTRYIGKICEKHPELGGERRKANRKCVKCACEKANLWAKNNKEKQRLHNKLSYKKNIEKRIEYREKTKEHLAQWQRINYQNKKEEIMKANRAWQLSNPEKRIASLRNSFIVRKRLIGGQLISKRYSKEIMEFYKNRPVGFDVDHQIPLRGKKVSGLHVPWNLQYLPSKENRVKGNKFEG